MDYRKKFADRVSNSRSSIIRDIFKFVETKAVISFAGGAPDINLLPENLLVELTQKIVSKYGNTILQYGITEGFLPLRECIVAMVKKRKINCSVKNVHISNGAQGALNTIAMTFINKGDAIVVESPTFLGAITTFKNFEPKFIQVKTDAVGIDLDALESILKKQVVKFIYVIPTFQNPTGNSISLKRKKGLLSLAKKYDVLIVEDDPYFDLRYSGVDVPPLYSFDSNHVIYVGFLSKVFSPSLRLGYVIANEEILTKIILMKQGIDLHASLYDQALAAEFIRGGYYEKHLSKIKSNYSKRLDTMLTQMENTMPQNFKWSKPEGGMFVWVTGSRNFNANDLYANGVKSGIAFVPGSFFFINQSMGLNTFRLNFTNISESKIEEGILKLSKLLKTSV